MASGHTDLPSAGKRNAQCGTRHHELQNFPALFTGVGQLSLPQTKPSASAGCLGHLSFRSPFLIQLWVPQSKTNQIPSFITAERAWFLTSDLSTPADSESPINSHKTNVHSPCVGSGDTTLAHLRSSWNDTIIFHFQQF